MTKKQLGVIYRAFKEGLLIDVDKEDIHAMYSYVSKMGDLDFARKEGFETINNLRQAVSDILEKNYKDASNMLYNFKSIELF